MQIDTTTTAQPTPRRRLAQFRKVLTAQIEALYEFVEEMTGGDPPETTAEHKSIEHAITRAQCALDSLERALEALDWSTEDPIQPH